MKKINIFRVNCFLLLMFLKFQKNFVKAENIYFHTSNVQIQEDEKIFLDLLRQFNKNYNFNINGNKLNSINTHNELLISGFKLQSFSASDNNYTDGITKNQIEDILMANEQIFTSANFSFLINMEDKFLEFPIDAQAFFLREDNTPLKILEKRGFLNIIFLRNNHYMAIQVFRHQDKNIALFRDPISNQSSDYEDQNPLDNYIILRNYLQKFLKDNDVLVLNVTNQRDNKVLTQGISGACGVYTLTYLRNDGLLDRLRNLYQQYSSYFPNGTGIADKSLLLLPTKSRYATVAFIYENLLDNVINVDTQSLLLSFLEENDQPLNNWVKLSYNFWKRNYYNTHMGNISIGLRLPNLFIDVNRLDLLLNFNYLKTIGYYGWRLDTSSLTLGLRGRLKLTNFVILDTLAGYNFGMHLLDPYNSSILLLLSDNFLSDANHSSQNAAVAIGLGLHLEFFSQHWIIEPKIYSIHLHNYIFSNYSYFSKGTLEYNYLSPSWDMNFLLLDNFNIRFSLRKDYKIGGHHDLPFVLKNRTSAHLSFNLLNLQIKFSYKREILNDDNLSSHGIRNGFEFSFGLLRTY